MDSTRYLPFIGRLFIGLPFMASGLSKLANHAGTIALIQSSKLPLPPPLAYAGAITVEVGCGLLIILGLQTRIVAAIFALFCLTTAVSFHTDRRPLAGRGLRLRRAQPRCPAGQA
jgi:putative oxidoreductase